MAQYALLNKNNEIINVIEADKQFAESIPTMHSDPNIETPTQFADVYKVAEVTNERVGIGFYKAANGRWVDGRPALRVNPPNVKVGGTVTAVFTQPGPQRPGEVVFTVGEETVSVPTTPAGEARYQFTPTEAGTVTVSANGLSVNVVIE